MHIHQTHLSPLSGRDFMVTGGSLSAGPSAMQASARGLHCRLRG